jgi:hypothetical protein
MVRARGSSAIDLVLQLCTDGLRIAIASAVGVRNAIDFIERIPTPRRAVSTIWLLS